MISGNMIKLSKYMEVDKATGFGFFEIESLPVNNEEPVGCIM